MTANNQSTTLSDNDISDLLKIKFKKSIIDSSIKSDLTFVIEPKILKDFIKFLKESRDLQFSTFINI